MRARAKPKEESAPGAPAYIVTFSDMVTLLLTFFVMLLSLANTQEPELFFKGQDSFVHSIRSFGLGMLAGRKEKPDFGSVKTKYFIEDSNKDYEGRTISLKEDELRRSFNKVEKTMQAIPSQIVAEKTDFSVTNIRFLPGSWTLNGQAKKFIDEFSIDLQQSSVTNHLKFYILGLASDVKGDKQQWILSAQRAQAVAAFLRDSFPPKVHWPVYAWGAGPGGDWVGKDSLASKQSHILIAVLRDE